VPEGHELIGLDQSTEGRFDQFVALFHVAEDLIPEDEESAIDPEVGILAGAKSLLPCRSVAYRRGAGRCSSPITATGFATWTWLK
jgi:hypothetical protein